MGLKNINPEKRNGIYIKAENWNNIISDPSIKVIDVRNNYETKIGRFKNSIDLDIKNFRDFPKVFNKKNISLKDSVAMYCTGGIRCEKSTSLLLNMGFKNVYHLEGGILRYLKTIPKKSSLWMGDCFVFDNRVSVDHNSKSGNYDQCYACKTPITMLDKKNKNYKEGISCSYCYDTNSIKQKSRFLERKKQIDLANKRGKKHIGNLLHG